MIKKVTYKEPKNYFPASSLKIIKEADKARNGKSGSANNTKKGKK